MTGPDHLLAIRDIHRRHTVDGETIRGIARERGCHASTVLRQVRRAEDHMQNPLFAALRQERSDTAVEGAARRILRRLREPGAVLVAAPAAPKAAVMVGTRTIATVDKDIAAAFWARGWIACRREGAVSLFRITSKGSIALSEMLGKRPGWVPPVDRYRPRVPPEAAEAGRTLRAKSMAGESVDAALGHVGGDLAEALRLMVIEEVGHEEAERRMGWPARSAKVVLRIALMRLAAFYAGDDRMRLRRGRLDFEAMSR